MSSQWHHIEGILNPADLASRGFMPSDTENMKKWLTGPPFLYSGQYPIERDTSDVDSTPLDDVATPPALTALTESGHSSALLIKRCGCWTKLVAAHKFMYLFLTT